MQIFSAGPKQRRIGPFLDKCVSEEEIVAFRQDESIADENIADVVRIADEMAQQSERETLADYRRGLKRVAVGSIDPVHACQHKALDGWRDGICGSFLGIAQQLLQEQRVAASTLDAGSCDALCRVHEAGSEIERLVTAQRTEINRCERSAATARAPRRIDRVAFNTRRHHQKPRPVRDR